MYFFVPISTQLASNDYADMLFYFEIWNVLQIMAAVSMISLNICGFRVINKEEFN